MGLSFPNSDAEGKSAKLQQLSDEVNRIAAILARLAVTPDENPRTRNRAPANDKQPPEVSIDAVRHAIKARRLRAEFFDHDLFADPAWDMLLDLFESELAQLRVSVTSLTVAAAVPPTTALRWINTMTHAGLFKRRADPRDGRRAFVELAPHVSDAMRWYFHEIEKLQAV